MVVVLFFTSCVNGSRDLPVNLVVPTEVETLTAGSAVAGGVAAPVTGTWASGVDEELFDSSTGTATSAATSTRAIGQSFFSRKSLTMPLRIFIARLG